MREPSLSRIQLADGLYRYDAYADIPIGPGEGGRLTLVRNDGQVLALHQQVFADSDVYQFRLTHLCTYSEGIEVKVTTFNLWPAYPYWDLMDMMRAMGLGWRQEYPDREYPDIEWDDE